MTQTQEFRCDVCARSFETHRELEEHAREAHEAQTGDVQCPACGMRFVTQEQLEKHNRETHY